ncbi:MAG: 4Fe-4S binding protein [Candidatus Geothermincolia bacterium]
MASVFVANPWFVYLSNRTIYQGKAKGICFPGFNCYACPLALYSCPIGSLQHSLAILSPRVRSLPAGKGVASAVKRQASYPIGAFLYVVGFIGLIGIVTGRLVCGWICPFGLLQDLMYKIPVPKIGLPSWMRFGKYLALVLVAMLIPFLTGVNWYSRLCPAGALEGAIPLKALPPNGGIPVAGWFFWFKIGILVAFLCWMAVTKRPFCRTACALGGAYALLAPISLYRMRVDSVKCTKCGECRAVCPVDINIYENADSPECVRCLDCKKQCPEGAVSSGFRLGAAPQGLSGTERGQGA